jgi:hypothetical protein
VTAVKKIGDRSLLAEPGQIGFHGGIAADENCSGDLVSSRPADDDGAGPVQCALQGLAVVDPAPVRGENPNSAASVKDRAGDGMAQASASMARSAEAFTVMH